MIWEHLSPADSEAVNAIFARHGLAGLQGKYLCFWGRGRAVQLDGDFSLAEMRAIIEAAEFLDAVKRPDEMPFC